MKQGYKLLDPTNLTRGLLTALMFATSALASAQADYPSRPLRLIVPFPPGGAADAIARLAGSRLSDKLGQPVSIENRPGCGTVIAAQAAASAMKKASTSTTPMGMSEMPRKSRKRLR